MHFIDQQYFLAIATLTLGMYKAASIIDEKINGNPSDKSSGVEK